MPTLSSFSPFTPFPLPLDPHLYTSLSSPCISIVASHLRMFRPLAASCRRKYSTPAWRKTSWASCISWVGFCWSLTAGWRRVGPNTVDKLLSDILFLDSSLLTLKWKHDWVYFKSVTLNTCTVQHTYSEVLRKKLF